MVEAMDGINGVMETMWARSRPTEYTSFRTFIFGITSQSMFPRGVVYEGVNGYEPLSFRGESDANDSMVPLVDNLLQVPMPPTPPTAILGDFRQYRPSNHRAFLEHVRDRSLDVGLRAYALGFDPGQDANEGHGVGHGRRHGPGRDGDGDGNDDDDDDLVHQSRALRLQLLDQVRAFRWRHWCFAREYILKRTAHPTATGGSPVVTWLPNQLDAVLADMAAVDAAARQRETLSKEVDKYCAERGVARG